MSTSSSQQIYTGSHLPPHRITSRNYDSSIQIHRPTSSPPKTPIHPRSLFPTYIHNPNYSQSQPHKFLRPNNARYPSVRPPSREEITATLSLQKESQSFTVSKNPPLPIHRSWHKSSDSSVTQISRAKGIHIDEHTLAASVTILLALLIAIGLPLVAVLPPRYVVTLPVNVLVPLYVNPDAGRWDRFVGSVIKHPETNFTVILNPSNGAGASVWPSGSYITEIKKINKLPNVQIVGYIDTQHGQRSNATVRKEIETYGGWNKSEIAVSGIFFDHTPIQEWDDQVNGTAQEYLRDISVTVKELEGFDEPRLVIFNPTTIPNANFTAGLADITVVFEGAYDEMLVMDEGKGELARQHGRREGFAYWVHSVPAAIGRRGVRKVVDRTRRSVEWLFLSDQQGEDRYKEYSDGWEQFLDLIW